MQSGRLYCIEEGRTHDCAAKRKTGHMIVGAHCIEEGRALHLAITRDGCHSGECESDIPYSIPLGTPG